MTARISGKTITLKRGDTFKAAVDIFNPDGMAYERLPLIKFIRKLMAFGSSKQIWRQFLIRPMHMRIGLE